MFALCSISGLTYSQAENGRKARMIATHGYSQKLAHLAAHPLERAGALWLCRWPLECDRKTGYDSISCSNASRASTHVSNLH